MLQVLSFRCKFLFVALKIFINFSFGMLTHFISGISKMNNLLVLNEIIFLLTEVHPHGEMICLEGHTYHRKQYYD